MSGSSRRGFLREIAAAAARALPDQPRAGGRGRRRC